MLKNPAGSVHFMRRGYSLLFAEKFLIGYIFAKTPAGFCAHYFVLEQQAED